MATTQELKDLTAAKGLPPEFESFFDKAASLNSGLSGMTIDATSGIAVADFATVKSAMASAGMPKEAVAFVETSKSVLTY